MLTAEQRERLIDLRRDFHRHPELAHQEHRTAGIVAERLRGLGLDEVRTDVGQTGVVGVLTGGRPGRTVMLRADMDALPLAEARLPGPADARPPECHPPPGQPPPPGPRRRSAGPVSPSVVYVIACGAGPIFLQFFVAVGESHVRFEVWRGRRKSRRRSWNSL